MNAPGNVPKELRSVVLLLHTPLRLGMAASLTQFIYSHGGRILYHDQYVDAESTHYYTRLKWDLSGFSMTDEQTTDSLRTLIGSEPDTEWSLHYSDETLKMAVFVSKDPWCLYDVLARAQSGEWAVDVPVIVSNHPDLEPVARRFGVEFRAFAVTRENKSEVEEEQLALLQGHQIDLVVLARYMQILTGRFVREFPNRIINIHHAFLPAFPGNLVSRGTGAPLHLRESAYGGKWYALSTKTFAMRFRFILMAAAVALLYVFATRNPFA